MPEDPSPPLNASDALVDICVRVAQFIGLPKSVGQIYGILFISPEPLCLDQCVERLQISQGSASQGLRELRQLRAVKSVYQPGDRRDFYLPETGLGTLAQGFLAYRVLPALDDLTARIDALEPALNTARSSNAPFLSRRLAKLKSWLKQAKRALNNLQRFLKVAP